MRRVLLLFCSLLAIFTSTLLASAVMQPVPAQAFDPTSGSCDPKAGGSASSVCTSSNSANPISGQNGIVNRVARLLIVVTGIAAVLVIIIAGFMMIVSNGDAQRVATARSAILYAAVGLIIVVLAQGIIAFVIPRLTK